MKEVIIVVCDLQEEIIGSASHGQEEETLVQDVPTHWDKAGPTQQRHTEGNAGTAEAQFSPAFYCHTIHEFFYLFYLPQKYFMVNHD